MLLPNLVSFVGVDAKTDLYKIREIQDLDEYHWNKSPDPVIEWGVIYSPGRAGKQNRYPTLDFVRDFIFNAQNSSFKKSLHLCGESIVQYLEDSSLDIHELTEYGDCRVQLNFAIDKFDQSDLINKVIDYATYRGHDLIIQHNKSKKIFVENLIQKMEKETNQTGWVTFLYDGSGGFGRVIDKFNPPIPNYYTGYAGGINPDNVESIVKNISKVAGNINYYIDMESGIRTDDWLDLEKCKSIMKTLERMRAEEPFA